MLKTKIAVLVSGGGTNLQQLLEAMEEGRLCHGEIALVISDQSDAYALQRASQYHVATAVVEAKSSSDKAQFEEKIESLLADHQIELIVMAGFLTILSHDFTSKWHNKIINVHPSLIPAFCGKGYYGLKVHQAALDYGVKITGATVHFVNEVPDGGEIILQKAVEILTDDSADSLQKRVMEEAEWIILPLATEMIAKKIIQDREQSNG